MREQLSAEVFGTNMRLILSPCGRPWTSGPLSDHQWVINVNTMIIPCGNMLSFIPARRPLTGANLHEPGPSERTSRPDAYGWGEERSWLARSDRHSGQVIVSLGGRTTRSGRRVYSRTLVPNKRRTPKESELTYRTLEFTSGLSFVVNSQCWD